MENKDIFAALPGVLLPWYEENKRDLPWRQDKDPYHIWLSEVMLQQTRVEAVKGYYARFLQVLPTLHELAEADDELLHKLWEGLGYYSRVRNLKKAARQIVENHGGIFPRQYRDVLALSGVGEYTAGAICSIAFDQPVPAVDGNVLRVVSRLTDDANPIDLPAFKKQTAESLQAVYPAQAGAFTQALMELGATVCGPNRKPDCGNCPCKDLCKGYQNDTAGNLPVKSPKRQRRQEDRTVFILSCEGKYALEKRPSTGLLADLWQFPNVEGRLSAKEAILKVEEYGAKVKDIYRQVEKKHIFTHIQWNMNGVYMEIKEPLPDYTWMTAERIEAEAALPTAFRQFWEDMGRV